MGTNFYARKKLDEKQKSELHQLINEDRAEEVINLCQEWCPEVHLCKRSAGWRTLWDHNNGEYFDLNRDSVAEFLKDCKVYDEYGEYYDPDDFIKSTIKWDNTPWKDGSELWTSRTYEQQNERVPEQWEQEYSRPQYKTLNDIDYLFEYGEYIALDGSRWSLYCDFS